MEEILYKTCIAPGSMVDVTKKHLRPVSENKHHPEKI
jgi:hypothetical protein